MNKPMCCCVAQGVCQFRKKPEMALIRQALLLSGFALLSLVPAQAKDCRHRYPTPETTALMFDAAQDLRRSLDAVLPQAGVVMLARGGQDLSRFGLTYSHLAFAMRDRQGNWRVTHELNHCKSDRSDLYREGLVNFVGESVLRADVLALVPRADVQARLEEMLIGADAGARKLHESRYNLVAYPLSTEYQNSNQWVLEVLVASSMPNPQPAPSRKQVQARLREMGYRPSKLHIKLHERLAARFGIDNATTVDHPASERLSGDYSVVTVDSVVDFMRAQRWLDREFTVPRPVSQDGEGNPRHGPESLEE